MKLVSRSAFRSELIRQMALSPSRAPRAQAGSGVAIASAGLYSLDAASRRVGCPSPAPGTRTASGALVRVGRCASVRQMSRSLALVLALSLAGSCGGAGEEIPGPRPQAADDDPAFTVGEVAKWQLVGNALTPGADEIALEVGAPAGTQYIDAWLGDAPGVRLERRGDAFVGTLDIGELAPGSYSIVLAADGAEVAFAERKFVRSHPLYVVVTTDWDDPDNSDIALRLQEELHAEHPELLLTHFVGPYTFTDPSVSAERRAELVDWVVGMRDDYGDEIGLHIHPYCSFVNEVGPLLGGDGVECRTEPSTVYASDDTGYTVMVSAYTEEEFTRQLLAADLLFAENGLGKPTSFRAGGWTADLSTLKALGNAGYLADTSANNWQRLEEWEGQGNGVLYEWNRTQWSSIGDTSQPYYPAVDNILVTGPETVPVLEVPDNGILVDYVSYDEMVEIFAANWPGGALAAPTNYSIGYHPTNFDSTYKQRFTNVLTHIDRFLASEDGGPVVYATLSNMAKVWPRPE